MKVQDPCRAERDLPDTGGIGGFFQDRALETLDEAACESGSSREELLLAIADEDLADDYERKYGEDPRSIGFLGRPGDGSSAPRAIFEVCLIGTDEPP